MKLLYAEDEPAMIEAVTDILTYHGYTVDTVSNGIDALGYARVEKYDGLVLDIMMPGRDGLSVLRELRAEGINTPAMLLTAKGELEDKIAGLDCGADDYLTKPFEMGELLARVRAMLRRREIYTPQTVICANVQLDMGSKTLSVNESQVQLSNLEYRLMELFMLNQGVCFSTEQLLERVWSYDTDADTGAVWVYISYLRKKLASLGASCELKTKRGVGYLLEAD